ncbi:hypothetical protein BGZ60DRAFT_153467 [Tricladium varicosporioides]|nr:hypothetical protein BGZ60DRAFT_153467 [Hymenoscyphus varicosporioides]
MWRLNVHKTIGNGSKRTLDRRFQKGFWTIALYHHFIDQIPIYVSISSSSLPYFSTRVVRKISLAHLLLPQPFLFLFPDALPPVITVEARLLCPPKNPPTNCANIQVSAPSGPRSSDLRLFPQPRSSAALETCLFVSGPCQSVSIIFLILFDNSCCRLNLR